MPSPANRSPRKRKFLIAGIVVGFFLLLGPVWGLLGTVVGMTRAFKVLRAKA
jgi:biopolymer transport protein ExbB/TolQ